MLARSGLLTLDTLARDSSLYYGDTLPLDIMAGEDCKLWLYKLSTFLSEYRWLLDSYIIVRVRMGLCHYAQSCQLHVQEFFTESHWSKLPWSWRESLMASDDESLMEIAQLIFRTPNSTPACRRQDIATPFPLPLLSYYLLQGVPLIVPVLCDQLPPLIHTITCNCGPS